MDKDKSFYKITAMSDVFRKFDDAVRHEFGDEVVKAQGLDGLRVLVDIWALRIQLAQAQQLTMISESLKKLCEKLGAQ